MRIKDIVAHLFDYHVTEERDWTLDRVTTWLQPLEPSEPPEVSFTNGESAAERDFSAEAAEWRKTSEAFEAQVKAKHGRPAGPSEEKSSSVNRHSHTDPQPNIASVTAIYRQPC